MRVLLKTRYAGLWDSDAFSRDFVRLTPDAARALVARGIRLIGIDYLAIGDEEVHRELLSTG